MKNLGSRVWDLAGWVIAGYSLYNQMKTLNMAKDAIYPYLSPDQQAEWNKYLGAPVPAAAPQPTTASAPITHLTSGT